jgi:hypothetical protein
MALLAGKLSRRKPDLPHESGVPVVSHCVFELRPAVMIVRAYSGDDGEPVVEKSWRLPQGLVDGGSISSHGQLSSHLMDARREALRICQARDSEYTLILPPLATLDRTISTGSCGTGEIAATVRAGLGPVFSDRRLYDVRWAVLGPGPGTDTGSKVIYVSVCRQVTIREYRRALSMSGMPFARIEPHLAGVLALCPQAGEGLAVFCGEDDVWRVLRTEAGSLRDLRLHYAGAPDGVPEGLLSDLEEKPGIPILMCGGTVTGDPLSSLPTISERVMAPRRARFGRFPVSFGTPPCRKWAGPAIAAVLIVAQVIGLVAWESHLACALAGVPNAGLTGEAAPVEVALSVPPSPHSLSDVQGAMSRSIEPTVRWPEMWRHVSDAACGLRVASMEVARGKPGVVTGAELLISGSGDLERILAFEKAVVGGPVKSASLVSLVSRDGYLAFQVRAECRP